MNGGLRLALLLLCALLVGGSSGPASAQAKPEGEMRWALYVTLPPSGSIRARCRGSSRRSGSSTRCTTRS